MKLPIQLQLWGRSGKGWDIFSRGATISVFGDEVVYIGPTPELTAYFWVSSGDCRYLTLAQLGEAGYTLSETYPKD
jgi:hypothetical protein